MTSLLVPRLELAVRSAGPARLKVFYIFSHFIDRISDINYDWNASILLWLITNFTWPCASHGRYLKRVVSDCPDFQVRCRVFQNFDMRRGRLDPKVLQAWVTPFSSIRTTQIIFGFILAASQSIIVVIVRFSLDWGRSFGFLHLLQIVLVMQQSLHWWLIDFWKLELALCLNSLLYALFEWRKSLSQIYYVIRNFSLVILIYGRLDWVKWNWDWW